MTATLYRRVILASKARSKLALSRPEESMLRPILLGCLAIFICCSAPLPSAEAGAAGPADPVAADMRAVLRTALNDLDQELAARPEDGCAAIHALYPAIEPLLTEYIQRSGDGSFLDQLKAWHRCYCGAEWDEQAGVVDGDD